MRYQLLLIWYYLFNLIWKDGLVEGVGNFRRGNVRPFASQDVIRVYIQFDDEAASSSSSPFSLQSVSNVHFDRGQLGGSPNSAVASLTPAEIEQARASGAIITQDPIRTPSSFLSSSFFFEDNPLWNFTSSSHQEIYNRQLNVMQKSLEQIQIPAVHRFTRGAGIKICIIDSGVNPNHVDLDDTKFSGFVNPDLPWNEDSLGHGTHVAGIIAAQSDNNIGITGVAPESEVFIVRAFGDRSTFFAYSSGIIDAAFQCINNGATIINMALAGETFTENEQRAFADMTRRGIILVAAAGNFGPTADVRYPAGYPNVISVSAVDENGQTTFFSQANSMVDIAAPGQDILSLYPDNEFARLDGTSMACAHVAGVLALLWSFSPESTAQQIRDALLNGADDRGANGRDDFFGVGIVNAFTSLTLLTNIPALIGSGGPPPTPRPTPPTPRPTPPTPMPTPPTPRPTPPTPQPTPPTPRPTPPTPMPTPRPTPSAPRPSLMPTPFPTPVPRPPDETTISLGKLDFVHGETITISLRNINGISSSDDLKLFRIIDSDRADPTADSFRQVSLFSSTRLPTTRIDFLEVGLFQFILFRDRSTTVLGESPIFTITSPPQQKISLPKASYVHGETVELSIRGVTGISTSDDLALFPANTIDFSEDAERRFSLFSSTRQVSARITFPLVGMYRFVVLIDRTPVPIAQSPAFSISAPTSLQKIRLDQSAYVFGETINLEIRGVAGISSRDDLILFNANETDFSARRLRTLSLFGSTRQVDARITFARTGMFKFVLLIDRTTLPIAESASFEISAPALNQRQLTLDQTNYITGETISIIIRGISGLSSRDDLTLFPANVTDYSSGSVRRISLFSSVREASTRINFSRTGMFKFVMLIDGTAIALAESPTFTISAPSRSQRLTLDQTSYLHGETIAITFQGIPGISTRDDLELFPANVTDFSTNPIRALSTTSLPQSSFRISFNNTGMFKLVLLIDRTAIPIAESPAFMISAPTPSSQRLSLDQTSYVQGETITISTSGVAGVNTRDDLELFFANVTDFSTSPIRAVSLSGSSPEVSTRINFVQTGSFRFVLFVDRTNIPLAMSPTFTISPQTSSQLTVDKSSYLHGETISITIRNVPGISTSDDLLLVPATATDFSGTPIRRLSLFGSTREASQRVDFGETGMFKFVLLIDRTTIPLAQTTPFMISAPASQELSLNKLSFLQGETISVTIRGVAGISTSDDLELRSADEDFSGTPIRRLSLFGSVRQAEQRIDFSKTGMFRFFLFVDRTRVPIAQSPVFEVSAPTSQQLTLDKTSYVFGETIMITLRGFVGVSTRDDILLFRAEETDFSINPIRRLSLFSSTREVSTRVDFSLTGMFKFVLVIDRTTIVLATSPNFEISAPTMQTLTLDQPSYVTGETITVSIRNIAGLSSRDDVALFEADETDFSFRPLRRLGLFSSTTTVSTRITFGTTGMFKFVLLLDGTTIAVATSPSFEISAPPASQRLALDQSSYVTGETIGVTLSGIRGISSRDDLELFPAEETDFSFRPIRQISLFSSTSSASTRINFVTPTGKYKFVLLIDGTNVVLATSPEFTISEPVLANLVLDRTNYVTGETVVIGIPQSDIRGYNSRDDLRLFDASETDFSFRAVQQLSLSGVREGSVSARITFSNTGMFKYVILIDGTSIPLAQSQPFTISGV